MIVNGPGKSKYSRVGDPAINRGAAPYIERERERNSSRKQMKGMEKGGYFLCPSIFLGAMLLFFSSSFFVSKKKEGRN